MMNDNLFIGYSSLEGLLVTHLTGAPVFITLNEEQGQPGSRADLLAFDKGRQPRGRPLTESATANREQERKRAYQREYRRKYRAQQKQAATETSASSKAASMLWALTCGTPVDNFV